MKKLTDTQKKWALTACLASVLSFNMVLSLAGTNYYGAASLASKGDQTNSKDPTDRNAGANSPEDASDSEQTHIKFEPLITNEGESVKVKYIEENNNQTVAIVPEKLESGLCYTCGTKYLLPKNFDSNAVSLEAALRKAMNRQSPKAKNIDNQESSDGVDLDVQTASKAKAKHQNRPANKDDQDNSDKEENPDFVALRARCDKKDDDQAQLSCYANGLTKLLKDKKKTFDRDEVMSLFREQIEPGLKAGLADVSDLVPRRASRLDMEMDSNDGSSRRQETQTLVEDMIAQIGRKYNYLRQRLTAIAAKAVLNNEESAQMKLKQADQMKNSDPQAALRLQNEGYARLRAANQVANDVGGSLYDGLGSAQWSNYISQDQFDSMYYDGYANVVNQAIRGMSANPLTYVIPSVTLADGTTIIDQNGQSFTLTPSNSPIVQNRVNGRGITVMTNNLTPANVVNTNTPRIAVNGVAQQGTATIQPFQATTAPTSQPNGPMIRMGVRGN